MQRGRLKINIQNFIANKWHSDDWSSYQSRSGLERVFILISDKWPVYWGNQSAICINYVFGGCHEKNAWRNVPSTYILICIVYNDSVVHWNNNNTTKRTSSPNPTLSFIPFLASVHAYRTNEEVKWKWQEKYTHSAPHQYHCSQQVYEDQTFIFAHKREFSSERMTGTDAATWTACV